MNEKRCPWAVGEYNVRYHDEQWGKVVTDDQKLFEFLVLEGMQAGLSWETILKKRDAFYLMHLILMWLHSMMKSNMHRFYKTKALSAIV